MYLWSPHVFLLTKTSWTNDFQFHCWWSCVTRYHVRGVCCCLNHDVYSDFKFYTLYYWIRLLIKDMVRYLFRATVGDFCSFVSYPRSTIVYNWHLTYYLIWSCFGLNGSPFWCSLSSKIMIKSQTINNKQVIFFQTNILFMIFVPLIYWQV